MTSGHRPRCRVIGVGNPGRGDDAAGIVAARALRRGVIAGLAHPGGDSAAIPALILRRPRHDGGADDERRRSAAVSKDGSALGVSTSGTEVYASCLCECGKSEPAVILRDAPRRRHAPIKRLNGGAPQDEGGDGCRRPRFDDIDIIEHSGEAAGLIACMNGAEQVILIDACVSGVRPGTIHRFDISAAPMPALPSAYSTHGFGLAAAVELARALGQLPRRSIVYAIEGASFEAGAPLSPPVAAAVDEVVRRLRVEIAGRAGQKRRTVPEEPCSASFKGSSSP